MNCPACNGKKLFDLRHDIRKCVDCGLEFLGYIPYQEELEEFYGNYVDGLARSDVVRRNAKRNIDHLYDNYDFRSGKILDFGCGADVFSAAVTELGYCAVGYDPHNPHTALDNKALYDVITMWGVLEHLTHPGPTLAKLYKKLSAGGLIAITTVSIETPIPYRHKPPEHTLYFTNVAIKALALRSGFRVAEYRPYRMIQDSDVYLSTLLRTMPKDYQAAVTHSMPKYVEIPTNEVFVVMEKV